MMGKDVERILNGINEINDRASDYVGSIAPQTAYRISTPDHVLESPVIIPIWPMLQPIEIVINMLVPDEERMNELAKVLYTNISSFNNGYGSPWPEFNKFMGASREAVAFAIAHHDAPWMGDKVGILALLNRVMSTAVDAKQSLIQYHDYIQRGYDHLFNNNNPSITFRTTIDRDSIGNIKQEYYENVNMPADSIDPY